jgi:hypothetical protein
MGINKIKYLGRKFFGVRNLNTSPVYDVDAQNYFNSNTAITSASDKNAINTFYLGLKSDGIYTKIKAMYLPIWGSAASSKWNLINPLDTNAAFRLTFSTGWTFSSGGMTGNGTSAFANTFLNPNSVLSSSDNHLSIYLRTNFQATTVDFGSYSISGPTYYLSLYTRNVSNNMIIANGNTLFPSSANADSRGFFLISKPTSSNASGFRNNIKLINNQAVGTGITSQNMYLGASNNNGTAGTFSNRQIAFASLGNSLTDTEAGNFYTAVQAFQTTLSRNV